MLMNGAPQDYQIYPSSLMLPLYATRRDFRLEVGTKKTPPPRTSRCRGSTNKSARIGARESRPVTRCLRPRTAETCLTLTGGAYHRLGQPSARQIWWVERDRQHRWGLNFPRSQCRRSCCTREGTCWICFFFLGASKCSQYLGSQACWALCHERDG